MRINELLETQQVDEISLAGVGKGIGNVAGAVGQGIGGAVGGTIAAAKRFGQGIKQGYKGASATVGGTDTATAPATSGGSPAGAAPAPAAGGSDPQAGGTAPAPAGGNAGDIGSIMQTIDKLDKPTKQQLAGELEKNIASAPEPSDPPAGGTTPPAGGQWPAGLPKFNSVTGQKFTSPEEAEKVTNSPEFKQQMADVAAGKDPAGTTPPAPAGTTPPAPAGTTPPAPAGGKMTQAQQDALKAKLQGQRQAGKTTATQTGSGFKDYVGGSQEKMAGVDASGAPVFKKLQRESVGFSKFLGMTI